MQEEQAQQQPLGVLQRVSSGRLGHTDAWHETPRTYEPPAFAIAGILAVTFTVEFFTGGAAAWGLSGASLAEGRWPTVGLHMLAHAGLAHILMNLNALLAIGPYVSGSLGEDLRGWLRFLGLFVGAGLAGAAMFLAINPFESVPMVGASGAICGLWGAAARIDRQGALVPLRSRRVLQQMRDFAVVNVVLFGVLFGLARLSGSQGGLAWESHLGGFLFGLLLIPKLLPERDA